MIGYSTREVIGSSLARYASIEMDAARIRRRVESDELRELTVGLLRR